MMRDHPKAPFQPLLLNKTFHRDASGRSRTMELYKVTMVGSTVGHYKILSLLGEGGMGVVYQAHDNRLDRLVALKFHAPSPSISASDKERFFREARAASALNHPNICTIHDVNEHDGRLYIVMEYVDGKTFQEVAGTLEEKAALALIDRAAEGLGAAHARQIVHRDIKSSNIMLTGDGLVKIMDFGLATVSGKSDITRTGSSLGTLAYMPPEQARGEALDHRADIYALGVVLFELLTGTRPFTASYDHAVLYQILNEPAPTPSSIRPQLSPSADAIVQRCLAKEASARYQTIAELRSDIAATMAGTSLAATTKPHGPVARASGQRWVVPVVSATLVVALSIGFVVIGGWPPLASMLGIASVPDQKHLVVLPFLNVGNEPDRQSLCDGLTESMTSQLTQLEQFHGSLWVVPASEVRRGGIASAMDARKAFGVNLVVDGALQMIGDRFRLTLNLVDATSLRQLNSASIDLNKDDLATLHDGSVMRVLQMLHVELHPETREVLQSGGTTIPSAYEYYLRGRGSLLRYESEENIDEAIRSFQKAVREDTAYALAFAALGEAMWRKYESGKDTRWVGEAIAACERAHALGGDLGPVNVTLGIVYAGTGDPGKAIPLFQAALKTDPAHAEAYRGLAKAYEATGELQQAEHTYRRAVDLRPDYWGGHNDLGVFYSKNSRYNDAITAFTRVTELTPDNYRGFNNLGGMYYFLQRWQEARNMFERSYALRPSYRPASNLGTLYYIEGKYDDAARWYEKALSHNANDHVVTGNLAAAYYWSTEGRQKAPGLFRKSIDLARRQLDVNPDDAEIMSLLGGYYAMVGDTATAKRFAERSLKRSSTDASIMFRAGTTYEQVGERDRALQWIGRALAAGYSESEIAHQPELRGLYADPRYRELIAQK